MGTKAGSPPCTNNRRSSTGREGKTPEGGRPWSGPGRGKGQRNFSKNVWVCACGHAWIAERAASAENGCEAGMQSVDSYLEEGAWNPGSMGVLFFKAIAIARRARLSGGICVE